MPQIVILAGPNGADNIARSLTPAPGQNPDLAAGRLLPARINEVVQAITSFALETNLAHRTLATRIPTWQEAGYTVSLVFVWLPSADLAVEGVAAWVRSGGHDIPEATIRRRYKARLRAFFEIYQPFADNWRLYDNSGLEKAALVAEGWIWQRETWKRSRMESRNEQQR